MSSDKSTNKSEDSRGSNNDDEDLIEEFGKAEFEDDDEDDEDDEN